MKDIAKRFDENPLLLPPDLQPCGEGLQITCLLNSGVFQYEGKTWLIVRGCHPVHNTLHLFPVNDNLWMNQGAKPFYGKPS